MATKTKATNPDAHIAPLSLGGTLNTEKYLFCNLKNVKETFVGRAQSFQHDAADLPNGSLAFLGDLKANQTHIYTATQTVPGGGAKASLDNLPWVMFRPEIVAQENSRMDKVLGSFRMKQGKPHPAWQLNLYDKIEYSEDYFDAAPNLNDEFALKYLGEQFDNANANVNRGDIYLKVVSIHEVQTPVAYSNTMNLVGMPESKKMYTLQLLVKA